MPVYYVVIGLLIGTRLCIETFNWFEKLDERFYLRWKKSQKNGFLINYIWSGLRSLTFIIVSVGFGQLFAYGRTPTDLVVALPSSAVPKIIVILIIISSIVGIISWNEDKKRYGRICYRKEKNGRLKSSDSNVFDDQ